MQSLRSEHAAGAVCLTTGPATLLAHVGTLRVRALSNPRFPPLIGIHPGFTR